MAPREVITWLSWVVKTKNLFSDIILLICHTLRNPLHLTTSDVDELTENITSDSDPRLHFTHNVHYSAVRNQRPLEDNGPYRQWRGQRVYLSDILSSSPLPNRVILEIAAIERSHVDRLSTHAQLKFLRGLSDVLKFQNSQSRTPWPSLEINELYSHFHFNDLYERGPIYIIIRTLSHTMWEVRPY